MTCSGKVLDDPELQPPCADRSAALHWQDDV